MHEFDVFGDGEQIHGYQPRHFRAEILLHRGDSAAELGRLTRRRPYVTVFRQLINEDGAHALSDDTIVEELRAAGIEIARRKAGRRNIVS